MTCGLCGSPLGPELLAAAAPDAPAGGTYRVRRCAGCGVAQVWPLPDPAAAQDLYFKEYWGAERNKYQGALSRRLTDIFLSSRVRAVRRLAPAGAAVLDYGCGNGDFVRAMRAAGYDCRGYDPNASSDYEYVNKGHEGRTYDLITLWHVFEHFSDPAGELARLKALLRPGGRLFLAVPNFEGLDARFGGAKWFHLDLPRHVFHYGPDGLEKAALAAGLRAVEKRTPCNWYAVFGLWQTLFNMSGCGMNAFYYALKRGGRGFTARAAAVHAVLGLPYLLISLAVSLAASAAGRSGALEIVCEKN